MGEGDICQLCAAVMGDARWHAEWHRVQEERLRRLEGFFDVLPPPQLIERPGGIFEHTGMGICNKGRTHAGPCDYGNGL